MFEGIEELDFVGPLEAFGVTEDIRPGTIDVFTIGTDCREIQTAHGLSVTSTCSFRTSPQLDIMVVPGGRGARREMKDHRTLAFVRQAALSCEYVTSVCTGALILAAAGLLDGKRATTHWAALDELRRFPGIGVEHRRYIRDGKVVTSAGISAGIDMSLFVIELLLGRDVGEEVRHRMEYRVIH